MMMIMIIIIIIIIIIIREVYTTAYKHSKFCQRCACVELEYSIVNYNYQQCLKYRLIFLKF